MAKIYVDSNASGANDGTSWTDAYATLQAALTAWTTSDEIWEAHNHTEGTATVTWTAVNDSLADRVPVYRVNSGTDVYSPTTGADTKQYNASDASGDINFGLSAALHGMNFSASDRLTASTASISIDFYDCYFRGTANDSRLQLGEANNGTTGRVVSCTINLEHPLGSRVYTDHGEFVDCVFLGYSQSTGLILPINSTHSASPKFIGCDFSQLTSASTVPLVDASAWGDSVNKIDFISCQLKAGQEIHDSGFINDRQFIYMHNTTDDGNTYETARYGFRGDVQVDTGVYYGGTDAYVDYDGDTSLSHRMIPASNIGPESPLVSLDMFAIVESIGSKTFTVEIVENYTSALTKRDCWIEVFYLGSATESKWDVADDREIVAASYTDLAAGSGLADWTGEPGGSRSEKVTASVTVNQAGVFMVRLHLANYESGKDFYYNPKVTVA